MSKIKRVKLKRGPAGEKDPNDYRSQPEKVKEMVKEARDV